MRVLAIESSCDDTGIAIYKEAPLQLVHKLSSQTKIHQRFGGVVPELASRDHCLKMLPLIESVLEEAQITSKDIDGIAYTRGPGLIGALMVGAMMARSLAYSWNVPLIGVHHLEGHLLAPMLEDPKPDYPFIGLLVSGGHTLLAQVSAFGQYEILGQSLDDAAGEAFDKTAKLLNLSYPGGPKIEKLAKKGIADRFKFPRPLMQKDNLNFSFSGLKTHVRTTLERIGQEDQDRADIAYAFEQSAIDQLVRKAKHALIRTGLSRLVVAGGVAANQTLRKALDDMANDLSIEVFFPRLSLCTDNGAMIAYAGAQRFLHGQKEDPKAPICVKPRWPLSTL